MRLPSREYRGSLLQNQFVRVTSEHGTVQSRHPGDLAIDPVDFPFSYDHTVEATRNAAKAFPSWRKVTREGRTELLRRYAELLASRSSELTELITFETGKPLWDAADEIEATRGLLASCCNDTPLERWRDGLTAGAAVNFFPRGVALVIPPGSEPLYGAATHMVPALLEGNPVILKAAKNAPATSQLLAELFVQAGFPPGVVQMIHGDSTVAQRLCVDPEIQTIFFTGHYEAALQIRKQIAPDPTKTLVAQTGGKSTAVVFADAPYGKALNETLAAGFRTSGQLWLSTHRIAVDATIFDKFVGDFHELSKRCKTFFPLEEVKGEQPFLGPLLNESMAENYLRFQGIAVREGCEEIMRGKALERERRGHYVSPSIHVAKGLDGKSMYQRSEIYGPNVCFFRLAADEDAAALLAHSPFGLAAAIYTKDRARFDRVLAEAPTGILHWNRPTTTRVHELVPGGIRRSGSARPMGRFAAAHCTFPVSSWLGAADEAPVLLPSQPRL